MKIRLKQLGPSARVSSRGSVTAETAVVLPVLVIAVVVGIWLIATTVAALRCGDAAREGARAWARGDSSADVRAAALQAAPAGSVVELTRSAGTVKVRVAAHVRPWSGVARWVPAIPVGASVAAAREEL